MATFSELGRNCNLISLSNLIDSSINLSGYVIMDLNLTYNSSYTAFSTAIFQLHFDIVDIQGIYTNIEFKYIQINYDWMKLYSNLNNLFAFGVLGKYIEGMNGDIYFGGIFFADTESIQDVEVIYSLGFEIHFTSVHEFV